MQEMKNKCQEASAKLLNTSQSRTNIFSADLAGWLLITRAAGLLKIYEEIVFTITMISCRMRSNQETSHS